MRFWLLVGAVALIAVFSVWLDVQLTRECMDRDGHSFLYCQQLLFGSR